MSSFNPDPLSAALSDGGGRPEPESSDGSGPADDGAAAPVSVGAETSDDEVPSSDGIAGGVNGGGAGG